MRERRSEIGDEEERCKGFCVTFAVSPLNFKKKKTKGLGISKSHAQ